MRQGCGKKNILKKPACGFDRYNNSAVRACRQFYRAGNFVPHFLTFASRLDVRGKRRRGGFASGNSIVGICGGVRLFSARFIGKQK